jgi:hypothetical protein
MSCVPPDVAELMVLHLIAQSSACIDAMPAKLATWDRCDRAKFAEFLDDVLVDLGVDVSDPRVRAVLSRPLLAYRASCAPTMECD